MSRTPWRLFRYRIPLTRPLHWGGGSLTIREGVILRAVLDDGKERWGELAPLPGWSDETLPDALQELVSILTGDDVGPAKARRPSVRFCLEALRWPVMEWEGTCPVNGLISLEHGSAEDLEAVRDCPVIKVKTGRLSPRQTLEAAARLLSELNPETRLRMDANRSWSWEALRDCISGFRELPLDYLEEPLAEFLHLRALAELGLPVGLDESLREPQSDLKALTWATAWVVKPTLMPGSLEAFQALAMAGNAPKVVISSSLESGLGIRILAWVSKVLLASDQPAGLDTLRLLESPLMRPHRIHPRDGYGFRANQDLDLSQLEEIANGETALPIG